MKCPGVVAGTFSDAGAECRVPCAVIDLKSLYQYIPNVGYEHCLFIQK